MLNNLSPVDRSMNNTERMNEFDPIIGGGPGEVMGNDV